jgi:CBS domain-containing protein
MGAFMGEFRSRSPARVCLSPDNTVHYAIQIMAEYQAALVLVKQRGAVVGIVTERIIRARVVDAGLDPEATPLSAIMVVTPDQIVPSPSGSLTEGAACALTTASSATGAPLDRPWPSPSRHWLPPF